MNDGKTKKSEAKKPSTKSTKAKTKRASKTKGKYGIEKEIRRKNIKKNLGQ